VAADFHDMPMRVSADADDLRVAKCRLIEDAAADILTRRSEAELTSVLMNHPSQTQAR